jgi:hypothetical protein
MPMKIFILKISILFFSLKCSAFTLYENFPKVIKADERYVIYSHGLIVEGTDPRPIHSKYGIYEFSKVKEAIFHKGDFNLISHHRPKNTDIESYVITLEAWVRKLITSGVEPSRISLVGFSRGSHLTALAADRLRETGINTVLLASCINGNIPHWTKLDLGGHLLSIYETSDIMGSCTTLTMQSENLASFKEVSISTDLNHGAFF